MKRRDKHFIVPVFIPHQGCPHRCVFCDQRSVTGSAALPPSPEAVRENIQNFLRYKGERHQTTEIAFYGGTFTGLSCNYQEALLKTAEQFILSKQVHSIRLSTRPDAIDEKRLDLLKKYNVTTVELGAQSMNDQTLSSSNRGHTASDTVKAVKLVKKYEFNLGLQIMPGLPGDTEESMLDTGKKTASLEPDMVRVYPTVVLKNSHLARLYQQGAYTPLTTRQAVRIAKKLLCLFNRHGIPVIRLGLQASDSLNGPDGIIAGPFHPAFGHMVHSAIFFDKAVELIKQIKPIPPRIRLRVAPRDVSKMRGISNQNIKELLNRFHFEDVRVVPDSIIPKGSVAYG